MEIYLNDFRPSEILNVIEEIKSKGDSELIFKTGIDRNHKNRIAYLTYIPYLHLIEADYIDKNEPLYCNPSCIVQMMPRKVFIKRIVPSEEYHKLMKAQ